MLQRDLADVLARERPLAGEQLQVHDGETVLIAVLGDLSLERLRGCVNWRYAAHDAGRARPVKALYQPEVGDFHAAGNEEQVSGLNVEVLKIVPLDHEVET